MWDLFVLLMYQAYELFHTVFFFNILVHETEICAQWIIFDFELSYKVGYRIPTSNIQGLKSFRIWEHVVHYIMIQELSVCLTCPCLNENI